MIFFYFFVWFFIWQIPNLNYALRCKNMGENVFLFCQANLICDFYDWKSTSRAEKLAGQSSWADTAGGLR